MMTLGSAAAEAIRVRMEEKGWDSGDLLRRIENTRRPGDVRVPKVTLWRKLNDHVDKFDLDTFDRCAIALGVAPAKLLREALAIREASGEDPAEEALSRMTPAGRAQVEAAMETIQPPARKRAKR